MEIQNNIEISFFLVLIVNFLSRLYTNLFQPLSYGPASDFGIVLNLRTFSYELSWNLNTVTSCISVSNIDPSDLVSMRWCCRRDEALGAQLAASPLTHQSTEQ